jgi:hypothetical protein
VDDKSLAYPAPPTEDQDHPHACLNGYVYIGHLVVGDDGEEVEVVEAAAARIADSPAPISHAAATSEGAAMMGIPNVWTIH